MGLLDQFFYGGMQSQADPNMQEAALTDLFRRLQPAAQPGPAPQQAPAQTGHVLQGPQQAAPRAMPEPSFLDRLSALSRGYDKGGLVGGIADALNAGNSYGDRLAEQQRNATVDMLVRSGKVDEATARSLMMGDPELRKSIIQTLFTKSVPDITEVYDEQGRPQKVLVDRSSGRTTPIGSPGVAKQDPMELMQQREDFRQAAETRKADTKRLTELREAADGARTQLDDLRNLSITRDGVGYEGGFASGLRTTLGKALPDTPSWAPGLPFIPSQEEAGRAESVDSLAENVRLGFVQKTKGAVSDSEMRIFGQATPGMQMTDAGAKTVMEGMEAAAARTVERAKFAEAYRRANGSLEGADAAWDQFVAANPVIQPDGRGGFTVNKANIGRWQAYAGGGQQAPASQDAPAAPAAAGGWGIRRLD